MRRREFIAGLGTAAWPLVARAQQPPMPVIGYLSGRSREAETPFLAAFRKGLAEVGYVENRNVAVEFRFADGQLDRVPALAADLARRQPTVIVAVGGNGAVLVRAADPKVPIVFNSGTDPVQLGWVASFNRPTGNMTGVFGVVAELALKNLSLLHELVPKASSVALLVGLSVPNPRLEREAHEAAATLGLRLRVFNVRAESELEAAYAALLQEPPDAMLLIGGPLHISRARQIAEFVARLGIPAIYNRRNYPDAGGLMSYGDNIGESYRYTGIYAGRILNGEKPADLPVYRITKLELVINLKTAKALKLEVPPTLLAIADEVIE
jgi:putative tryptophan/tyrosine transport system substrate-binding protein